MKGKMLNDVELAGTFFRIPKGTIVNVIETTNLPATTPFKYFVSRPGSTASIAVYAEDVEIL